MIHPPSHPVLTCAETKAWESALLKDETAEWEAMKRAGGAVACAVLGDFREIGGLPDAARLLVLVGKGNNGGDALLAAKAILETRATAAADVLFLFGTENLRPLAARSWRELQAVAGEARVREITSNSRWLAAEYHVCLDGVFGFQFRPPLDDATAEVIAKINTHPRISLRAAVDLPTGIGETNAETVFRADFTYATGIVKSPVLSPANAAFVGRVRYLDLGFFDDSRPERGPGGEEILLQQILAPLSRLRPAQTDKRTFGHLFVIGGSRSYPGAVLMTVQAALRSGVGLLTAFVPASLAPEYAAKFPEAMWVGCPETDAGGLDSGTARLVGEKLDRATAVVVGPGLGAEKSTLDTVRAIAASAGVPLVFDADSLRPEMLESAKEGRYICTPHAGEFRRIAPVMESNGRHVLVLKGSPTRVVGAWTGDASSGTSKATIHFSLFGGPVLARGGSGDLLAGLIGGLLAQAPEDLLLAACRGVVWHGLAADLLARDRGQVAVQTTQLLDYLESALQMARNET